MTCQHCNDEGYFLTVEPARGFWMARLCGCMKGCCDEGWIDLEQDGYDYVAPCPKCTPARQAVRRMNLARLPSQHDPTASKPKSKEQARAMKLLRRWVKLYKPGAVGFTLQGPVGTGKSHCLIGCCRATVHTYRIPVYYWTLTGLWSMLRKHFGSNGKLNADKVLEGLCNVQILALDEVIGPRTEWQQEVLQHILTERYDRNATTIMTTNLDAEGLMEALGDGIDAERIISRLGQWAPTIELNGPDLRAD